MKNILAFLLPAALIGAVWYFFFRRQPTALGEHLNELWVNAEIGRITNRATQNARVPVQTIDNRGPFDGLVWSLQEALGLGVQNAKTTNWRPNDGGDPSYLPPEDRDWTYSWQKQPWIITN
jgi:hypothetical protein